MKKVLFISILVLALFSLSSAEKFMLIVIPDTQGEVSYPALDYTLAGHPKFESQVRWIAQNKNAKNIKHVTHVGDEAISTGHGFPLRLVAPGYRGYAWVKWVTGLEVSRDPAWLESPLPLQ